MSLLDPEPPSDENMAFWLVAAVVVLAIVIAVAVVALT
jgi:hypothetical protein